MSIYIFIKLIRDPNNNMPLREWSLFMGRGGGGVNGGGGANEVLPL
jgi:hypothetical protein